MLRTASAGERCRASTRVNTRGRDPRGLLQSSGGSPATCTAAPTFSQTATAESVAAVRAGSWPDLGEASFVVSPPATLRGMAAATAATATPAIAPAIHGSIRSGGSRVGRGDDE